MAKLTLEQQQKELESIKKVFGPEFTPSSKFTPELQESGVFGAVNVTDSSDPNKVFTLGSGGTLETPESFQTRFGTLEQEGIVGGVTLEQARLLGITEFDEKPAVGTSDDIRNEETQKNIDEQEVLADKDKEIVGLEKDARIKELKDTLEPDVEAPKVPDLLGQFTSLRSAQGVDVLEKDLNDVNAIIRALQDAQREELIDEEGRPIQLGALRGRQADITRDRGRQIDALLRQKNEIVNELSVKNSMIQAISGFTQQDFINSKALYDSQFSQNIQLINNLNQEDAVERSEKNRMEDIARANAQFFWDNMDKLDAESSLTLSKLEAQAGLPQGFYAQLKKDNPNSELISTTSREVGGQKFLDVLTRNEDGSFNMQAVPIGAVDVEGEGGGFVDDEGNTLSSFEAAQADSDGNPDLTDEELKSALLEKYTGANVPVKQRLTISQINSIIETRKQPQKREEDINKIIINAVFSLQDLGFDRGEAESRLKAQIKKSLGLGKDDSIPKNFNKVIKKAIRDIYGETLAQQIIPFF